MKKLFERIDSVFILVSDMERSVNWYKHVLGLELLDGNSFVTDFKVNSGDTMLTLVRSESFNPSEFIEYPSKTPRFNFKTNDIDFVHKVLKEKKVDVSDIDDRGVIKTFYFKDPDHNLLNVCYESVYSPYYQSEEGLSHR
jgi:glyoxylase I family protein